MTASNAIDTHTVPTRYWHALDDQRVQCDLCPRACRLREGQRGLCFVRECRDGAVVLTAYGRSSGFCIDPIEKKPLHHFYPGSSVLSFGTAGCNLACKFCQNWDISKSREVDTLAVDASPAAIARSAQAHGCRSVAFTYNDPVIFHEYAVDVAQACREIGVATVAVTAGYICSAPRATFFRHIDAANVDLKAFSESFYQRLTGGHLAPVLDTLEYIVHGTDTWLEITCLLIPGCNDSAQEIAAMSRWIREHLGAAVPLHFSAFHPDWKMRDVEPTPAATAIGARQIARAEGLLHVYTGNLVDRDGDATCCLGCGTVVVQRASYDIEHYGLDGRGCCSACGTQCAGRFDAQRGYWGRRRQPVRIA